MPLVQPVDVLDEIEKITLPVSSGVPAPPETVAVTVLGPPFEGPTGRRIIRLGCWIPMVWEKVPTSEAKLASPEYEAVTVYGDAADCNTALFTRQKTEPLFLTTVVDLPHDTVLASLPVIVHVTVPVMWVLGAIRFGVIAARKVTSEPVDAVGLLDVTVTVVAWRSWLCAATAGAAVPSAATTMPKHAAHFRFFTESTSLVKGASPRRRGGHVAARAAACQSPTTHGGSSAPLRGGDRLISATRPIRPQLLSRAWAPDQRGVIPHEPVHRPSGRTTARSVPDRSASGGQLIGSTATAVRRCSSSRVSPV